MYASLPWYDFPEIRSETNTLWDFIAKLMRNANIQAPSILQREIPYSKQWLSSSLLFSQACGYDIVKPYANELTMLGTPCYDVPGCNYHNYASFIIVHKDSSIYNLEQLYNKTCAINCQHSHSGANILYFVMAQHFGYSGDFFSQTKRSGSHENSIRMILEKKIDTAAIDCVTYQILKKYRPQLLEKIRIIFLTPEAPAPPYVASSFRSKDEIRVVRQILSQLHKNQEIQSTLRTLFIKEIKLIPLRDYNVILDMEKIGSLNKDKTKV